MSFVQTEVTVNGASISRYIIPEEEDAIST